MNLALLPVSAVGHLTATARAVAAGIVSAAQEQAATNDAAVIARLAAMQKMDYDRVRREEAKTLGIQTRTLDEMVKAVRSAGGGPRLPFVEHEPADDPVDPAALFDEIASFLRTYVVLETEQSDALAIWLAMTYLSDMFDVAPIAIINAPERACAKTLLQTVMMLLAYHPLPASNASLSALFRAIEHWGVTLFIDEADTFFRDNAELHGMINAGYKRGGYVLRSEVAGDSFEPRMFPVYGLKSIAGIALEKHLPDSTMSRGIVINMRRKLPHEKVQRLRNVDKAVVARLGSQLARFAQDHAEKIRAVQPILPEELSDRAQDNWEPLLAIASCAGQAWVDRITAAAIKISAEGEPAASNANELLSDIRDVLGNWEPRNITTVDLIAKLCTDDDMEWATYNRGRALTPRQLAKQLDIYGIKPKTVRQPDGKTPKGYEKAQFEDAFTRYLKPTTTPSAPAVAAHSPGSPAPEVAATAQRNLTNLDTFDIDAEMGRGGVADTGTPPPLDEMY